jgi:hypothetical protein
MTLLWEKTKLVSVIITNFLLFLQTGADLRSGSEIVLIALLTRKIASATVHGMRSNLDNPFLTYQDTLDMDFAVTHGLDFVTVSYAAKAADIEEIRYVGTTKDLLYNFRSQYLVFNFSFVELFPELPSRASRFTRRSRTKKLLTTLTIFWPLPMVSRFLVHQLQMKSLSKRYV